MNDLDKRLREILTPLAHVAGGLDDYGAPDDSEIDEEVTRAIAQIHEAFKEAGYIEPSGKYAKLNDKLYVFNGSDPLVKVDLAEFMTGQEWYDRFEKEFHKELPFSGTNQHESQLQGEVQAKAFEAARRAAGLDQD